MRLRVDRLSLSGQRTARGILPRMHAPSVDGSNGPLQAGCPSAVTSVCRPNCDRSGICACNSARTGRRRLEARSCPLQSRLQRERHERRPSSQPIAPLLYGVHGELRSSPATMRADNRPALTVPEPASPASSRRFLSPYMFSSRHIAHHGPIRKSRLGEDIAETQHAPHIEMLASQFVVCQANWLSTGGESPLS